MADASTITIGSTTYNLKDTSARNSGIYYGTCSTAASTAAKVVTCSGMPSGVTKHSGLVVVVKFTYDVPANATLNVNSLGSSNVRYLDANIKAGVIRAGNLATFVFDGSYYQLMSVESLGLYRDSSGYLCQD